MKNFLWFTLLFAFCLCAQSKETKDHHADSIRSAALLDTLEKAAMTQYEQGHYHIAVGLFERIYDIDTATFKPDDPRIANDHYWIGECYEHMDLQKFREYAPEGSYDNINDTLEALTHLTKFAESYKAIYSNKSKQYAMAVDALSEAYWHFDKNEEAYLTAMPTIKLHEDLYGKYSKENASFTNSIAIYCSATHRTQLAVKIGKKSLDINRRVFGTGNDNEATLTSNLAFYLHDAGNNSEAAANQSTVVGIYKKTKGCSSNEYASALCKLAEYQYLCGNDPAAVKTGEEVLDIYTDLKKLSIRCYLETNCRSDLYEVISCLSAFYESQQNITKASLCLTELISISDNNNKRIALRKKLVKMYLNDRRNKEAVSSIKDLLDDERNLHGKQNDDYISTLHTLTQMFFDSMEYSQAMVYMTELDSLYILTYGMESPQHADAIGNLSILSYINGNAAAAISIGKDAERVTSHVYGNNSEEHATALSRLAFFNDGLDNSKAAAEYESRSQAIRLNISDKNNFACTYSAHDLNAYRNPKHQRKVDIPRQYIESIVDDSTMRKVSAIVETAFEGSKHFSPEIKKIVYRGWTTGTNIRMMFGNARQDQAGDIGKAMGTVLFYEKIYGTFDANYANALMKLADAYDNNSEYQRAIMIATEACDIYRNVLPKGHPDYAAAIACLAAYHSQTGDYSKALQLNIEAERTFRIVDNRSENEQWMLDHLATSFWNAGKHVEAIQAEEEALRLNTQNDSAYNEQGTSILENLASFYSLTGKGKEAIVYGKKVVDIRKRTTGKLHGTLVYQYNKDNDKYNYLDSISYEQSPSYSSALDRLAVFYYNDSNYSEAQHLLMESLRIKDKYFGPHLSSYASTLFNLAQANEALGNYSDCAHYAMRYTDMISSEVRSNFATMTARERENFWTIDSRWFTNILPKLCYAAHSDSLCMTTYDAMLLSKGILLNTEIEMKKMIAETGNDTLMRAFTTLQTDKTALAKKYENPKFHSDDDVEALAAKIQGEEKALAIRSKAFGNLSKRINISWHDVQKNLTDEDIAIEFVNFTISRDTTVYAALILKKGMGSPTMIRLFDNKMLDSVKASEYYTTSKLYSQVWKPLAAYLQGVTNIYFAPSGVFHHIAVEYLPVDDKQIIADKYHCYRLSSTRELTIHNDTTKHLQAVLYGGLEYQIGKSDWAMIQRTLSVTESTTKPSFRDVPSIGDLRALRNGLQYLEGTAREVEAISNNLRVKGIPVTTYEGINGTEDTFKRLSGKRTSLIHIATHGFYLPPDTSQISRTDNIRNNLGSTDSRQSAEDRALSRSGLFFTGAADALAGKASSTIPIGMDDGILTSKEISRLDLRDLDLIVLSACQTGEGDISGEGVFGLQRGFKKAGAQTIVMSLWKVSDTATQLLMERFYAMLTSGHSKRDAFIEAQRYLRKCDGGHYDKPEYWAAFVMLDAI